jgi:hypothetical protein
MLPGLSWFTTIPNDGRVTLDPKMLRRSRTVVQIYIDFEATRVDPDQYQKIVSIFSIYTIGGASWLFQTQQLQQCTAVIL